VTAEREPAPESSPARQAAAALAAVDALGQDLERIAQAATERPARSAPAVLAWLDRTLAELAWQLRVLERACALRARDARTPHAWDTLGPNEDGGLRNRIAALKPDMVIDGVSGMFAGWLEDVGLRDDHYALADPFVPAASLPALLSRRLAEVVADLEPVRAGYEALGTVAAAGGDDVARRADGILDFVARRVRVRLALRAGWAGLIVRRHLESLRKGR
jgi:hypothetical protein